MGEGRIGCCVLRLASSVGSGVADCAICGHRIEAWDGWDLAHAEDRRRYLGPAHRACNRATNRAVPVERTSRAW